MRRTLHFSKNPVEEFFLPLAGYFFSAFPRLVRLGDGTAASVPAADPRGQSASG
jgi:hypothetical protein